MKRRKDSSYFPRIHGSPEPLRFSISRRVVLSEVDALGIVWYGRYASYCEAASQELGRRCGLGYHDFHKANLLAPIVQFHIDYHQSLAIDDEFIVTVVAPWCEGAKLLIEFEIRKKDRTLVATAYTVQMFIDGSTKEILIATPKLLEKARERWRCGEFSCLK